jgi:hypothetical protein
MFVSRLGEHKYGRVEKVGTEQNQITQLFEQASYERKRRFTLSRDGL